MSAAYRLQAPLAAMNAVPLRSMRFRTASMSYCRLPSARARFDAVALPRSRNRSMRSWRVTASDLAVNFSAVSRILCGNIHCPRLRRIRGKIRQVPTTPHRGGSIPRRAWRGYDRRNTRHVLGIFYREGSWIVERFSFGGFRKSRFSSISASSFSPYDCIFFFSHGSCVRL